MEYICYEKSRLNYNRKFIISIKQKCYHIGVEWKNVELETDQTYKGEIFLRIRLTRGKLKVLSD